MITFKPQNLRELPADVPIGLRKDRGITLILVKACGETSYGNTVAAKDAIVSQYDATADLLMLAWTGQYKTDVFRIDRAELAARYA